MKKVLGNFLTATNEIFLKDNHLLHAFSLNFSVITTVTVMTILYVLTGVSPGEHSKYMTLMIAVLLISSYPAHWIYHKYAQSILLKRGWKEDSRLHGVWLMFILQVTCLPTTTITLVLLEKFMR